MAVRKLIRIALQLLGYGRLPSWSNRWICRIRSCGHNCEMQRRAVYQPETYGLALLFMILSMLCWGSWANSMKLCPGYRFQLFYWDYVIGLIAGAILWGSTLGSLGTVGRSFYADVAHS